MVATPDAISIARNTLLSPIQKTADSNQEPNYQHETINTSTH
ncbi:hypothetical protein BURMUCGD1_4041 [Burkholderia multivorans CGD1]|nr:hypothetical protein BURMUCGD1_4041 [Burkholderia multivorans CGD1]